ncbi:hypothetical protein CDAR_533651 [Caerostris darwini]|uniref:Uncharacterized protein n=1 Tax=Caerostris darwini TaxID=1538125 RepID=A0AAV4SAM4_9ARAC|nr:hypothetical protein CDAR_533651 [Caerostris darwini]
MLHTGPFIDLKTRSDRKQKEANFPKNKAKVRPESTQTKVCRGHSAEPSREKENRKKTTGATGARVRGHDVGQALGFIGRTQQAPPSLALSPPHPLTCSDGHPLIFFLYTIYGYSKCSPALEYGFLAMKLSDSEDEYVEFPAGCSCTL